MSQLPQEIVDRICDYLQRKDLKQTLKVCRTFQYASERASGEYRKLELSEQNVDRFLELYNGRRFGYLRELQFKTSLPAYGSAKQDAIDNGQGKPMKNDVEEDAKVKYQESDTRVDAPRPIEKINLCRESQEERRQIDERFTNQIQILFNIIKTIEQRGNTGWIKLTIYTPRREIYGCFHRKFSSWRVHLLNPSRLPELNSIHALTLKREWEQDFNIMECKPDPRILIDLAVKLSRLEYLGCEIGWQEWDRKEWDRIWNPNVMQEFKHDWEGPRRDARHDFAQALANARLPATLRRAQLDFLHPRHESLDIDHSSAIPDLVSPAQFDPLSSSLRLFASQLRVLELVGVFDSTLFFPAEAEAKSPFFPHLELLSVTFHISTPSGEWYFNSPPEGHRYREGGNFQVTDEHYPPYHDTERERYWDDKFTDDYTYDESDMGIKFRIVPNDALLTPFLAAFAKAASPAHMPSLKAACLWTPLEYDPFEIEGFSRNFLENYIVSAWGVTYIGPGVTNVWQWVEGSDMRRLWWRTDDWRPSEELNKLFSEIGGQSVDLVEDRYGNEPPIASDRKAFEMFKVFG